MSLSQRTKDIVVVALADKRAANELNAAVDAAGNAQGAAVADVSAANASDLATAITLANANKVAINALLASLRAAGLIAT